MDSLINDNLYDTHDGAQGGTFDNAPVEYRLLRVLGDAGFHGSSQTTGATGAGNSTNIHQAGSNPAGSYAGAYQWDVNMGADDSASLNPPQPTGHGYFNGTAHYSGHMGPGSSGISLAATLQRANASHAASSGLTQPDNSFARIDPALWLNRSSAAPPAAFNGGMPQDAAPEGSAGPLASGRDTGSGQYAPAPASPRPVAQSTSGAADRSANRQTKGKGKAVSRGVGPRAQPIPAQGRALRPQAQETPAHIPAQGRAPQLEAQEAPAQEKKAVCKKGGAPLRDRERKGNEQGATPGWNVLKHHHRRCDHLKADGCIPQCQVRKYFPLTCEKWRQQRFQVKWDGTEVPKRPEIEVVSGFAVDARKYYGFKVIGEVLADGRVDTKSKTVHRVDEARPPRRD